MSLESTLAAEIKNISAVTALVADRIYPVVAPQTNANPLVTYRRVPSEVMYTHEGESRIQKAFFHLAAVADKYEVVIELAAALRAGLSGKRFSLGDGLTQMAPILFKDPEDAWNQETGLFVRTQECTITYRK